MIAAAARLLERYFNIRYEQGVIYLNRLVVTLAAAVFLILSTVIVGFEQIFSSQVDLQNLQVNRIAPRNIYAPETITYVSEVLTQQKIEQAAAVVRPIFDAPDPLVARQQTELARQVLDFINNIRRDPYGTLEQKADDLRQITALDLDDETITQILNVNQDEWQDIDTEIIAILERVMRGEIKTTDLQRIRQQLPTQVSVRFDDQREINSIVEIVGDLLRANTRENIEATEAAIQEAVTEVEPETRSFEAGQLVIASGTRITLADYEALQEMGLLREESRQIQTLLRAFLASIVVMVVMGLYIARIRPSLMHREPRFLLLLASLFLIALLGARFGLNEEIYIYPAAALALLYVAIIGPEIAIIGMMGLAFLVGVMASGSLEIATLIGTGGIIGALTLRHPERLNSFFFAGLLVAVSNLAVSILFNLNIGGTTTDNTSVMLVVFSVVNGALTAGAAIAGMYLITTLFNLPTALKLVELSQPNQPLLQRLLREAPGTYQHSLQVANLSEQAANAINANAELTRVAALYHDIGKMLNPVFFTENQTEGGNPHDTLGDPYRSADIIIGHVTQGDEIARQYRLPNRVRDFIREHHGTSQVYVFYKQALILANDDESQVDTTDFTYPGPRPQSRETAILMLADSCEAAVRSRQPKSKQEIEEIVQNVIDMRRKSGQLDESNLSLNDLNIIHNIFVDILQAMYHPRIDYDATIAKVRTNQPAITPQKRSEIAAEAPASRRAGDTGEITAVTRSERSGAAGRANTTAEVPAVIMPPVRESEDDDDDDTPFAEVPRLKRTDTGENQAVRSEENGTDQAEVSQADEPTSQENGTSSTETEPDEQHK
ncbi:MAG: HD family phosphohydrolase [Chloroflexota bacterium]